MKKILLLSVLLLTGCTQGEELTCNLNGKTLEYQMKDGIIKSYKIDGTKASQKDVDELNGTYFTSSKNNEEGRIALKNYIENKNGNCNY